MITDFFIAALDDAMVIASDDRRTPDYSTRNADNAVLAGLWSALDASSDAAGLAGEAYLVAMGSAEGPWVFDLPDDMTARLSALAERDMLATADRWARSEALSYHQLTGADMLASLVVMKELAGKARSADLRLLLRMAM